MGMPIKTFDIRTDIFGITRFTCPRCDLEWTDEITVGKNGEIPKYEPYTCPRCDLTMNHEEKERFTTSKLKYAVKTGKSRFDWE
jgi:transposase-like protein